MQYLTVANSFSISLHHLVGCLSYFINLHSPKVPTVTPFSACSFRGRWCTLHVTPPLLAVSTPCPPLQAAHPLALHPARASPTAGAVRRPLPAPTLSLNNRDIRTIPLLGTALMPPSHHHPVLFWSAGTSSLTRRCLPKTWH